MGLDTVELLMEVENYFRIQIPNPEAEQATTIQEMSDTVARQMAIDSTGFEWKDSILTAIAGYFSTGSGTNPQVELSDSIAAYLSPDNEEKWRGLEDTLGYTIPKPSCNPSPKHPLLNKIKNSLSLLPDYNWTTITVEHFIDTICTANYSSLVDRDSIKSQYEVYIAVAGITAEKMGIDPYEIRPEKSFTSDLGID